MRAGEEQCVNTVFTSHYEESGLYNHFVGLELVTEWRRR